MGGAAALVHVYPNGNYKLHLGAVLVQCVPEEILTSLDSAAAATAHSLASSEAAASWRARAQPTAGGTDADGNAAAGNDSGELSPGADDSGGSGSGSPMRGPQSEEHAAGGFAAQMAAAANAGSSGGAPAGIGTAEQVQHTAHAAQQQQQSAGRGCQGAQPSLPLSRVSNIRRGGGYGTSSCSSRAWHCRSVQQQPPRGMQVCAHCTVAIMLQTYAYKERQLF